MKRGVLTCGSSKYVVNDNLYPGPSRLLTISGVIDLIIGPNISALRTSHTIIGPRLPVAAARKVEPRFEENSVNNSLVIANIGDSVALHCNIWMKQVQHTMMLTIYSAGCFIIKLILDPIMTILRLSAL